MNPLDGSLNCWIAPGFDLKRRFEEMKRQVNANGGAIDQSYFYLDHQSALEWCQTANAQGFLIARGISSELIQWIADSILFHLRDSNLDPQKVKLISLGSGEAQAEIQLVNTIQNKHPLEIALFLLDASPMLLQIGHKNAIDLLMWKKGIATTAVQGDFYQLHQMPMLFDSSQEKTRQLRIGCLLGCTLGNIPNEIHFIQESLTAFQAGDLFILDATLAPVPSSHKEEILKHDPRFSDYSYKEFWEHWVQGPLKRYRNDFHQIKLQSVLETRSCQIPGSYNVIVQGMINEQVQMNLMRIRRYDTNELIRAFQELGWRSLGGKIFGERNKQFVCIFERM